MDGGNGSQMFLANNCYILVSELSAVLIVQVGKQLVMLVNVLMQVLVLVAVASHLCANCNQTVPNFLVGCRILAECKPAKYFSGSCGGGEHYLRWMWHVVLKYMDGFNWVGRLGGG